MQENFRIELHIYGKINNPFLFEYILHLSTQLTPAAAAERSEVQPQRLFAGARQAALVISHLHMPLLMTQIVFHVFVEELSERFSYLLRLTHFCPRSTYDVILL